MDIPAQIENDLLDQWDHTTLENEKLFNYLNGLWKGKKPPYVNVKVLRNTNFNNDGTLSLEDVAELPVEEKQFRTRKLIIGDILLERSGGGPKQPVGRVVYFDLSQEDYSFSNFTTCIRVKDEEILIPKFLLYYLLSFYNQGNTNELQQRTTGIRNLNFADYKKITIPLPTIHEQTLIVFILKKLQQAIDQQEKIIAKTKKLKRSLMHRLFTHGLRGEELKETEIGLMPESWGVQPIGKCCQVKTSFASFREIPNIDTKKENDEEVLALKVSDMNIKENSKYLQTAKISFRVKKDNLNRRYLAPNSLVFPKRGAAIATNKKRLTKKYTILDPNLIGVEESEYLGGEFLYYYFETVDLKTLQDNTPIPQLNKHNVVGKMVPIPNREQQDEIVNILKTIDFKVKSETSKKEVITDMFKTMLNNFMTGQARIKDVDFGEINV